MKIKKLKLYRPVTMLGSQRETISSEIASDIRLVNRTVWVKDNKGIVIVIPLTNIEHMVPEKEEIDIFYAEPVIPWLEEPAEKKVKKK